MPSVRKSIISLSNARCLFLASQYLNSKNSFSRKKDLLKIIETLGYVQIDTISVVERSHHHILWTRMPSYRKTMLNELLEKDKSIFEYWGHAAAFLPMKDFRYSLIRKGNYSVRNKIWKQSNKKILKYVYDRIKNEGALQSRDFQDYRKKTSGWWDWKPSKDALDFLFHEGVLMIASRKGFQKVYDLTERVLPERTDTTTPSESDYYKHLILQTINSHGFASRKEINYLRNYNKKIFEKSLIELIEENRVTEISVEKNENESFFTTNDKLKLLNISEKKHQLHILSPFDNLIIQRKKVKSLFNFDYQVECYLPASKRKFGYFCMPFVYGEKFLGSIDAKADRSSKRLIIYKINIEDKVKLNSQIKEKLKLKLNQLCIFAGCEETVNMQFNLSK